MTGSEAMSLRHPGHDQFMTKIILTMMAAASLALTSMAADNAKETAGWIDNLSNLSTLEVAPYGVITWEGIGGDAELGVGLYLQNKLTKNTALRLSAEAGRERVG